MKRTINLNPIMFIGVILLAVLLYFEKCTGNKQDGKDALRLVEALQDSLRHYKNKDSMNVATISVIQTESAKDFLRLQLKDKELQDLQALVKEYRKELKAGSSVTAALIETVAELKGKKPEIKYLPGDTVWLEGIAYINATYRDTLQDEWITLDATMGKDSSNFNLKVVNKFSAIVGYQKRKPFVDLITENPYTTVKSLRTFQVSMPKPKKFGIGFSTGVTLNSDLKPAPYVGIGINYNILRL